MTKKILAYIQEDLLNGSETIAAEDDLLTSGLLDSMAVMKLITFVEEEFKTAIPPEDMTIEHFMSVETIQAYLQSRNA